MDHEPQQRSGAAERRAAEQDDEPSDPVQEADEQSFPASDPPSSWVGGDPPRPD